MVAPKLLEIEGLFFLNSKENTFSGMTGKFIKQLYSYGIDGCTDGWLDGYMGRCKNIWTGRWMYVRTYGGMAGWIGAQMNTWMNR